MFSEHIPYNGYFSGPWNTCSSFTHRINVNTWLSLGKGAQNVAASLSLAPKYLYLYLVLNINKTWWSNYSDTIRRQWKVLRNWAELKRCILLSPSINSFHMEGELFISDIHLGLEEVSRNEEPGGRIWEQTSHSTLPAQPCSRETENVKRTGFLLYSFQPPGLKSAG